MSDQLSSQSNQSSDLNNSNSSLQKERIIDSSTGQFIDPLFAVIIAAGLSETFVLWVKNWAMPEFLVALIVLVGYINILLSWFGYHKSTKTRPIKSIARFIITVSLLPLYLLTIIISKPDTYQYNLVIYLVIFILWCFWDCLKYYEYNEPVNVVARLIRVPNIIIYLLIFNVFILSQQDWFKNYFNINSWYIQYRKELAIFVVFLSISLLRIANAMNKPEHPINEVKIALCHYFLGRSPEKNLHN